MLQFLHCYFVKKQTVSSLLSLISVFLFIKEKDTCDIVHIVHCTRLLSISALSTSSLTNHPTNQPTNQSTTHSLTTWSRVLLEKLVVPELVKKFSIFYGTQWFITMFTRAHHLSLSLVREIQYTPSACIIFPQHRF
jgi:hypothetical protein